MIFSLLKHSTYEKTPKRKENLLVDTIAHHGV